MEINGMHPPAHRTKVLKAYRESSNPVLLIVSNIGTMNLNLECANILIITVSFCSSSSQHEALTNLTT